MEMTKSTDQTYIQSSPDHADDTLPANDATATVEIEADPRSSSEAPGEHKEPHFKGADIVRDVVIGMSDGLTVPFALTAGLSNIGASYYVVTAGLAGALLYSCPFFLF